MIFKRVLEEISVIWAHRYLSSIACFFAALDTFMSCGFPSIHNPVQSTNTMVMVTWQKRFYQRVPRSFSLSWYLMLFLCGWKFPPSPRT